MTPLQKAARARREKIIAMGPDLPTRQEVADAIGITLKVADADIRMLINMGKIRSVKKARKARLSPEKIEEIRADYVAGMFREDISRKYGLWPERVSQLCKGLESPHKYRRPSFDGEAFSTIADSYISTTYADTKERAEAFQAGRRDCIDRATKRARLRSAA